MRRFCVHLSALIAFGCSTTPRGGGGVVGRDNGPLPGRPVQAADAELPADETAEVRTAAKVTSASYEDEKRVIPADEAPPDPGEKERIAPPAPDGYRAPGAKALPLEAVVQSVYTSYPYLHAAIYERNVASGYQLAAAGGFDTKLKASSENGPTGYYQTYRQMLGLSQPTYNGGELFAGYRIGRGDYQPWYQERQTNGGGEFKAGFAVPLGRNRTIDARRAELWRSTFEIQRVEPDIQAQLIGFVQEASYAYWDWVAAGRDYRISKRLLALAENRTQRIEQQVEAGFIDPPELTDNLRLIADRKAKLASSGQKLQEKAVKLSLYLRDDSGDPIVPGPDVLNEFPEPDAIDRDHLAADAQIALRARPELKVLDLQRRQYEVDYAEAHNDLRPQVDGVLTGSQDMGEPTSSKGDKSEFEAEASLFVEVPLQRRKGRGKMQVVEGKLSQLAAKRRYVEDKIVASVQTAYIALASAHTQVLETREAVRLAEELAVRERQNFDAGASDLLKVTLREQYAVESAFKEVEALLLYYRSQADYRAALAQDLAPVVTPNVP
ncbi:Outer membrane efflux protein [Caulifigura coniformis]|uniref:Outer membrane efflux protein n=1 Tax=Caulifigura coniformis TaxID=2527983 RepID=A0A517SIS9_9PLAN|nr:TolC family protein [Caulifigura coniformis]QDT56020.1 Outer membrane efflux protein [Caulifigura coniformis]